MKFSKLVITKKTAIASCLLASSFFIQPAIGCSTVNDEFSKLENDWTSHCGMNSGWGTSGYESYCFLTWKSLQTFISENESCISQRNEDVIRKGKGTA